MLADLGIRQTLCTLKSDASPEGEIVGGKSGKRVFLSLPQDVLINFRERGRDGKREKHQCEGETGIGCPPMCVD